MKPLSFVIVGSGWRSLFFVRIAKRYPQLFELKYMLCRTEEKAARMAETYGIPVTTSVQACVDACPDFAVVAVNKNGLCAETKKWAELGIPVLCETPAAESVEDLKALWELVQQGAKIQIAEQYHRYPVLAHGLKMVSDGKLADPYVAELSLAHEYHGFSMIRRMLQPDDPMCLKLVSMVAEKESWPVTETDSRNGAITDGSVGAKERVRAELRFCSKGAGCCGYNKVAYYDFSGVQYHSFIRARHINVQGRDGEWNDTLVRFVNEEHLPETKQLTGWFEDRHQALVTPELKAQVDRWLPSIDMSNGQDEYAIATMMFDMGEYIAGGREVYPMAEALEDAYLTLLLKEALAHPGQEIKPEIMPWQEKYNKRSCE